MLATITSSRSFTNLLLVIVGVVISIFLIVYPEINLSLFLVAGSIKGDPHLAFLRSVDLTVLLGGLLFVSLGIRLVLKHQRFSLPKHYWLFIPLCLMALISLYYTPDFETGVDKALKFYVLTGIAVFAPFVILQTPRAMTRFLVACAIRAVAIALVAFEKFGQNERLTAPSGDNLALGYQCAAGLAIVLMFLLPRSSLFQKCASYLMSAVLVIGLIGAGARGALISVGCYVVFALILSRRLFVHVLILGLLIAMLLPAVPIADFSYRYLGTLFNQPMRDNLGGRNESMAAALTLMLDHPLTGVGIGGFQAANPAAWNYPHNIFLEIGCEMGMIAVAAFIALVASSFVAALKGLRDSTFQQKDLFLTILALLTIGLVGLSNTGDINDNRAMWLYISLPFALAPLGKIQEEQTLSCRPDTFAPPLTVGSSR